MQQERFRFRPSSLSERGEFYSIEFSLAKVKAWFRDQKLPLPQICALDAGTETGIIVDKKLKNSMLYFPFSEILEKIKEYVPEDVYYDRNHYAHPEKVIKTLDFSNPLFQELAFDVDADNIACEKHNDEQICSECLEKAYHAALLIKTELARIYSRISIIYSGRGFHVHVLDKAAFLLSTAERRKLNEQFSDFPIDIWVSGGRIRLIRMPYSLNALVSRKVLPLKEKQPFEPEKAIPLFLLEK